MIQGDRLPFYEDLKEKLQSRQSQSFFEGILINEQIKIKKLLSEKVKSRNKSLFRIKEGEIPDVPRVYSPGDSLRRINISKTIARMDHFKAQYNFYDAVIINQFKAEKKLWFLILNNVSATMLKDEAVELTNDVQNSLIIYSCFIQALFFILSRQFKYRIRLLPYGDQDKKQRDINIGMAEKSFARHIFENNFHIEDMMLNGNLEKPLRYLEKQTRLQNHVVVIINSFEDFLGTNEEQMTKLSRLNHKNDLLYFYIVPENYGLERSVDNYFYKGRKYNLTNIKQFHIIQKDLLKRESLIVSELKSLKIDSFRIEQHREVWLKNVIYNFILGRLKR